MAVVSDDHAHESMCREASTILSSSSSRLVLLGKQQPRPISPEDILEHNRQDDDDVGRPGGPPPFWAVVDGWVVDATEFVESHPGGLRKLMSTDMAEVGATGGTHGFSFSRGKNAHFPDTGRRFGEGVEEYLRGGATTTARGCDGDGDEYLPPGKVSFPPHGSILILGRLSIEG
jgi:hypothetical protein